MATRFDWSDLATRAVTELLTSELAAVKSEIEAKVSERRWGDLPKPIDPHHITNALKTLASQGFLIEEAGQTRGGRVITVVRVADTRRRQRKVTEAAARKRLLHARYRGWASGTKTGGVGVIGPALESVVHRSLREAAPHGYRLFKPEGGDIEQLFGAPVPFGPLDNAALLTLIDAQTFAPVSYMVPIEAKNLRLRIYPIHAELHQLLAKSAALQAAHPTRLFVPILVCRRAHFLTFAMAKALGFYVIETRAQYIRPHVTEPDPRSLQEVIDELGYQLEPHDTAVPPMVKQFAKTAPKQFPEAADRWAQIAEPCREFFAELRNDSLRWSQRRDLLAAIAETAADILGEPQNWHEDEANNGVGLDDYFD